MNIPTGRLLAIGALVELLTGVGLILTPLVVLNLILGTGTDAIGTLIARLAGVALLSLGVSTWVSRGSPDPRSGLTGMLVYNALAAVFFLWLGLTGMGGLALWLIVVLHAAMAVLFALALRTR